MIVQLKQGSLKGKTCTSVLTGKNYYGFYGIPYAKPPIGDLRFQEPKPHEGWEGVRDATIIGSDCVHFNIFTKQLQGQEDSLFLNVFTPKVDETNLKPVMVFIHGGGYAFGSGNDDVYGPDYLLNYDVVLVTINYRLHALGFLNLGIPECPGNVGMKDQVLALKWVKNNIRSFGGDDKNITLFGESAGAGSVHLHMISPLSKGLFNRCVLQSGNSLCPWSITKEPEKYAYLLGKELGYEGSETDRDLVAFLKTVNAEAITTAVNKIGFAFDKDCISVPLFMVPSVEKIKEGAFLPEEPDILLKSAEPVPVIIGLNDKEYIAVMAMKECTKIEIEEAKKQLVPSLIRLMEDFKLDTNRIGEVVDKVIDFYLAKTSSESEIFLKVVDLFSDLLFGVSMYRSVDHIIQSRHPVYVYQFTFLGAVNLMNLIKPGNNIKYASHADELSYLFYSSAYHTDKEIIKKEPEKTVIENICKLWTNFAKTGNPNGNNVNVEWIPSTVENPTYLQIGSTLIRKEGRIDEDRVNFWDDIIKSYSTI